MAASNPFSIENDLISSLRIAAASLNNIGNDSMREGENASAKIFAGLLASFSENEYFDIRPALYDAVQCINKNMSREYAHHDMDTLSGIITAIGDYIEQPANGACVERLLACLPLDRREEYLELLTDEYLLIDNIIAGKDGVPDAALDQVPLLAPIQSGEINMDSHILSVVHLAVEDIRCLAQKSNEQLERSSISEAIKGHLENISFIAESCGDESLTYLCEEKAAEIEETFNSEIINIKDYLLKQEEWFLLILDLLPELIPGKEPADTEPFVDIEMQESEFEVEPLVFTDERLEILYDEISQLEHLLDTNGVIITSKDISSKDVAAATDSYSEIISRLAEASKALGLDGLQVISDFIIKNVNEIIGLTPEARCELRQPIMQWPVRVKLHLQDPQQEEIVLSLIDLLQDTTWPSSLDGIQGRDLYVLLAKGPDDEEEFEQIARPITAEDDDVSLELPDDLNHDLFESFMIESPDLASQFNDIIGGLLSEGDNLDSLHASQRLSHTLKGSANLVGIRGIANLAHHIEDILDNLARQRLAPSKALVNTLQEAADTIEAMIDAVSGADSSPGNSRLVLQSILDWANLIDSGEYSVDSVIDTDKQILPSISGEASPEKVTNTTVTGSQAAASIRVPTVTVDDMFSLVEELTISLSQINEHVNKLKQKSDSINVHDSNLQQRRFDLENLVDVRGIAMLQKSQHKAKHDKEFDPLEMDQYDELHGVTHSFIEAVADSREISSSIHAEIVKLDGYLLRQLRLTKELQQIVVTTRMVPVNTIASRLQRGVRQACRATDKQAELVVNDNNILVDSDVLSGLVDPLLHLLRNAVDHGVEYPDERAAEGKSVSGNINLNFSHQGNSIVISCSDDGRGLDYEAIRGVALQKGLIKSSQDVSNEELSRFIMSPSFTTRSSATQVSGRGIGMDAVYNAVICLKGTLSVHDIASGGTEFIIRLPISMVTNHSLILRSGDDVFAVPTSSLQQILPPGTGMIEAANDRVTFRLDKTIYPVSSLASLLGGEASALDSTKTILITTKHDNRASAIAVDYVLQSSELVVKQLGKYVSSVRGVSGVSVLGDGQVVPVLDVIELLDKKEYLTQRPKDSSKISPAIAADKAKILIVDDSLSVRNSLSQLVGDSGYEALTARDGIEAADILQKESPLVVLVDLEMPRMDGIELTRHIRANDKLRKMPVIMITSRTQKKHRDLARSVGVDSYLTKPFMDDDLLDTISSLV